ncbi:FadR/GntR family transcriptional regulator [Cognatiyoonia sp. IB215182]|uniref:FadR/GntR family transcriptional regulator n=1 Tax=Cognatiyoonia sp. IB215182 TaxID=3097353 RepID=UPI002A17187E|nr:FadR/GntR family transcriptional regulator [Cognatiyoonia sp. IB215182]MDX8351804.1 FadR/GntR family transcriptional regulator [Cognatiyoonia sp. IB215182]
MNIETSFTENTTQTLRQIRQLIDSGSLPSDGRLPTERELSQEFGISRRAVRRALEVLEAEGLIWRKQGKGTFAGKPPEPASQIAANIVDEVDALAVMEARLGIEPQLAALCARRATVEDVERLRHLAVRLSEAADSDASELWDGAMHRMIARIADNPILSTAFDVLEAIRAREDFQHSRQRARTPETREIYTAQHDRIIAAIDARDSHAARAAMTEHLETLIANLKKSLEVLP